MKIIRETNVCRNPSELKRQKVNTTHIKTLQEKTLSVTFSYERHCQLHSATTQAKISGTNTPIPKITWIQILPKISANQKIGKGRKGENI